MESHAAAFYKGAIHAGHEGGGAAMNIISGQREDPTVLVRETIGLLRRVRISAVE